MRHTPLTRPRTPACLVAPRCRRSRRQKEDYRLTERRRAPSVAMLAGIFDVTSRCGRRTGEQADRKAGRRRDGAATMARTLDAQTRTHTHSHAHAATVGRGSAMTGGREKRGKRGWAQATFSKQILYGRQTHIHTCTHALITRACIHTYTRIRTHIHTERDGTA